MLLTYNLTDPEKLIYNPPTYFRLNGHSEIFQLVTDTYGIPRYKEINPTLFNIITFPFQFGVMFGDIFHGTILMIVAIFILIFDNKLFNIGNFKYTFIQMAFWALFMGFIYNDFNGMSLNLFHSC